MGNDKADKHPKVETLSQYVRRILAEKQLTHKSVEERSEKGITDAYIGSIVKGKARNLSVDRLKALAVGLDEPEDDIFNVARGLPLDYKSEGRRDPWPSAALANAIQRIVSNPELTKILKALLRMTFKELQAVLEYIESMKKPKSKD